MLDFGEPERKSLNGNINSTNTSYYTEQIEGRVGIHNRTISSSLTSGVCNTEINITDVTATTTNYLVIKVTTTAGTDRVSGGIVDIERV